MTWRRHTKPNMKKLYQNRLKKNGKGEVNWTEMNETKRAIENLEDNTDDYYKIAADTQGFEESDQRR